MNMTKTKTTVKTTKTKEEFVHSVFESIAPKYDLMNNILASTDIKHGVNSQ